MESLTIYTKLLVESLEIQIEFAREYLHRNELERKFDPKHDVAHGKAVEKLHKHINIIFKPGYFVDPLSEMMFPNIGQIFDRLQLSRVYNSFETLREKQQNIIIKAKRAFELQGKTIVNSLKDYLIYFVN